MGHLTLSKLKHEESVKIPKTADVVIVGAGMSGLYTAWRIMQEQPKTKVLILERSLRTGGRLQKEITKSIKQYIDPAFDPTDLKQSKPPIVQPMTFGVTYVKG